MEEQSYVFKAVIPSIAGFGGSYPQYGSYAAGDGGVLFAFLMSAESCLKAIHATELKLPAVAGLAEGCHQLLAGQGQLLTKYQKQFIGAAVCCLMKANGYGKTGTKKAIPHKAFTKGEFYMELASR